MNHLPEAWGRPRDDIYGAYDHQYVSASNPNQHTTSPVVTGTSVVALKYNGGVVIAADNLASYGSLARFTNVERLKQVGSHTVVGASGDVSDMQFLFDEQLEQLIISEEYQNDGHHLRAKHIYSYLSRVMYHRRSKFNPLWNVLLVAGWDDGKPFLASTDLLGTTFSGPALASGFGAHLAIPLLRRVCPDEAAVANITREQAISVIEECMKVLFYRDARSMNKYSMSIISGEGDKVEIEHRKDIQLKQQSWKFAESIRGYGAQVV
ncbi:nucleophile aminohydrolase [Pyronema domesticum]|uniref:Proteasome subunit beta n=1 Tax=Pyronema omphalodes (strain CBS 100304) TaxID=1076935 RepID=U4KZY4_PYROM|nr:nucleophile aminohydrolase [Pyronema domesticum]CCX05284.1 Similar to Proteasome component PRE4; acc. no. P30657 [Pyronema omphalodes CBS 100304]